MISNLLIGLLNAWILIDPDPQIGLNSFRINYSLFRNKRSQQYDSDKGIEISSVCFIFDKGCVSSKSSFRWLKEPNEHDFCCDDEDDDEGQGLQWDMTSMVDISSKSSRSLISESSKLSWLSSEVELSIASSTLVHIRETGSMSSQKYLKSQEAALRSRLLKRKNPCLEKRCFRHRPTLFESYSKCRIWVFNFGIFHQFLSN